MKLSTQLSPSIQFSLNPVFIYISVVTATMKALMNSWTNEFIYKLASLFFGLKLFSLSFTVVQSDYSNMIMWWSSPGATHLLSTS